MNNKIDQVIILHYTLPPVLGGVEKLLYPLAEQFVNNGFIVTFLAGRGSLNSNKIKTTLIPELDPQNTNIVKTQDKIEEGLLPENYKSRVEEIEKKIETRIGYVEHIIIHNMMTMPFNIAATEALWNFIHKYPDKNYYIWTHDMAWRMEKYQNKLYDRYPWNLLKKPVPQGKYITISEYRKKQLVDLLGLKKSRVKVIPNVINIQDFLKYSNHTNKIISKLALYNRYPVILLPVRILPRKNIEHSVNILSHLQNAFPDMVAVITGEYNINEDYYKKIKSLIDKENMQQNIVFMQDVFQELNIPFSENSNIVRDLYFVSHLVLYLSKDEGFGLPILESAIARTPIVLSDLDVFQEITQDNANYLSNSIDPETGAQELRKILVDKKDYQSLNMRVTRQYNWEFWWDRYLKNIFKK